jgi:hypothetical protein
MNAMRRGCSALWITATFGVLGMLGALAGCGGAEPPAAVPPPASVSVGQASTGYGSTAPMAAPEPPPPPPAPGMAEAGPRGGDRAMKSAEVEAPPADRPGLGTQWGETRTSRINMVSFERADTTSPFVAAALYYNDEEGARAMTGASGFRRTPGGSFTLANGLVSVGLRDESSRFFTGFIAGGRDYVVGDAGHRYVIVVRNNTNFRLEVVLSVDGLDVLDGKPAAFGKRGYIVDPRGEVEVDGFRQSTETVAAFRFGSVRGSYAGQKYGDTRNVGVIGVAVFNEVGTNPVPWTPDEVQRRRDANPFPGQFATPPG